MGNTQQQRLTKHIQEVDEAINKRLKPPRRWKYNPLFVMMAGKGTDAFIKKLLVLVCLLSETGEEVLLEYLKKMKENVQITTFKLAKKFLLKFCPKFSEEMRATITEVLETEEALPTQPTLEKLLLLWNHETVKTLLGACTYSDLVFDESHLNLSAKLFLSNLPKIFSESYIPLSCEAVLSDGIVEYHSEYLTINCHEGAYTEFSFFRRARTYTYWKKKQRGGMKHWANTMERCDIMLFVCPLTSYNRMTDEPYTEMKELYLLLGEITNSRFFSQATFVLVFTERNSFEEEIKWTSIKQTFDDYTGDPKSATESLEFIKTKFLNAVRNRHNYSCYNFVVDMADEEKEMSEVTRRQLEIIMQTNLMV